jgi:hypothetical protein
MLSALLALTFLGPFTVSGNFPADLYGSVDTRMAGQSCAAGPCIWGHADASILPIKFKPPTGYRVRILSLQGDLTAQIKTLPGDPPAPRDSSAGVLLGFSTTSPEGSVQCDWCADNTMLYVQDYVNERSPKTRAPFRTEPGVVLEPDNVLLLKLASWLNTTEHPIHVEGTYTIRFRYERND